MAEVKVLYDQEGKTLTVWFEDASQESVCEETGEEPPPGNVADGCEGDAPHCDSPGRGGLE